MANQQISVRIEDEVLKKLDNWRRNQEDVPTRPEAIRRLVEQALEKPSKSK